MMMCDVEGEKPSKISRSDLYKPPTNEELSNLKETEMLFHSNLIRLEISETLSEITTRQEKRKRIDNFLQQLCNEIMKIPSTSNQSLEDSVWLEPPLRCPYAGSTNKINGKMPYLPPSDIKIIGSYKLEMEVKQNMNVDLLLMMPKECIQAKDHLNHRYLKKRALYLSHVASKLSILDFLDSVKFSYFLENFLKPVVLLVPSGKLKNTMTIRLHCSPTGDRMKINRFQPLKSNIRKHWYNNTTPPSDDDEEVELFPTPHYNSSVLVDLLMNDHYDFLHQLSHNSQSFKDSVKLLKVWLKQRKLDEGFGCFNGFLMSMLVAQLLLSKKINLLMSSFQIVRNVFKHLSSSDWTTDGLTFQKCDDLQVFHQHFEVVFVDFTGKLNLCSNMSSLLYHQVRHEAKLSLEALDIKNSGFSAVFMEPVTFNQTFDCILHFPKPKVFDKCCTKANLDDTVIDHAGNHMTASLRIVSKVLMRGLGNRIHLLGIKPHKYKTWKLNETPPGWSDVEEHLSLALMLNTEHSNDILLKGPNADSTEAAGFREFWGNLSELRRFKDGAISEAVVWEGDTSAEKRNIPVEICQYLLQRHCNIPKSALKIACCQFDNLLEYPPRYLPNGNTIGYKGTGEEVNLHTIRVYNELCQDLHGLKSLPLSITTIQGTSPVLRCAEVLPSTYCNVDKNLPVISINKQDLQVPIPLKNCPSFTSPIEVVCHMEASGKWPQDADALQRLKAAFHVAICDELRNLSPSSVCIPKTTHCIIMKIGIVFKVCVAYHREIAVLQTIKTNDGLVKMHNTPESLALEKKTVHLPYLASTLHGLYQKHNSFGNTCRLAKRWISCHLMSRHIPDEAIELTCARLFISPHPHSAPESSQVGFLRFLQLLSTFQFSSSPLIVNLDGSLTDEDHRSVESYFTEHREALPSMCIMTPRDRKRSIWTSPNPSKVIIRRLQSLAKISLDGLEDDLSSCQDFCSKTFFTPSYSSYDVIIHLKSRWLPRKHESVSDCRPKKFCDVSNGPDEVQALPVVGFDPVEAYLNDLEDSFGEFAFFFHDKYGGSVIGVLWKPSVFQPLPFKISSLSCKETTNEGKVNLNLNVQGIVEDFKAMGLGLVESIDLRTEKWQI